MQNVATPNTTIASVRTALIAERDRVASKSTDMLQVLAAPVNVAIEDHIPLLHEQFIALARHSHDRCTLALITAAVDRLDRGEYGICEQCEAEISLKRLHAIPWASRCVPCQEQFEFHASGEETNAALAAYG
jgi:RNA polymerase-binding transcription factor